MYLRRSGVVGERGEWVNRLFSSSPSVVVTDTLVRGAADQAPVVADELDLETAFSSEISGRFKLSVLRPEQGRGVVPESGGIPGSARFAKVAASVMTMHKSNLFSTR